MPGGVIRSTTSPVRAGQHGASQAKGISHVPRIILACLFAALLSTAALAQSTPVQSTPAQAAPTQSAPTQSTPAQTTSPTDALNAAAAVATHGMIGPPSIVELGDQATLRLSADLYFVPTAAAEKLIQAMGQPVPPDFLGLLLGPDGLDMAGAVRFVPAGLVDTDAILGFTPGDILASLQATVDRENKARESQPLARPFQARGWVQPPHYDAKSHQLTWAALVLPASEPRGSEGTVIFNAVAFGRDGFIRLAVVGDVERAAKAEQMTSAFLDGLSFNPGHRYQDAVATTPHAENGLAKAMDLDSLGKAPVHVRSILSGRLVPVAGGVVAAIGAVSLCLFFLRYMRRETRRG